MNLEAAIAEAKRNRNFGLISDAIPYAEFLGISAEERDGRLTTRLAFQERNVGNPVLPALHGGVVGAFLETAAIFELLWSKETVAIPKTINLTIDYLRPAGPRETCARGTITKQGRRIANVAVEAWQEDPAKPIASAICHFLLVPAKRSG